MAKVSREKKAKRLAFARERGAVAYHYCPECSARLPEGKSHWMCGQVSLRDIMDGCLENPANYSCYGGPGEEDGPWAEGWAERSGEGLPESVIYVGQTGAGKTAFVTDLSRTNIVPGVALFPFVPLMRDKEVK